VTKILLLGAGGFIGSHLVEHLVGRGEHEVIAADISDEKLAHIDPACFRFVRCDIRHEQTLLESLIIDADLVVDLIAYANPSLYVSSPLAVFELNFLRNLDIARLCVDHGRRLIQYSSAEIYGKAGRDTLCREDDSESIFGPVEKTRWIYATGKLLLERVLHAYGQAGQLEYTIVRPFNFVGSRIDYLVEANAVGGPRVFPHFMSALLTGGPIRLVDGGRVHRAFTHIADANAAFQTLLDRRVEVRNQIFNIGNPGNNTTIRALAHLMRDLYEELTGDPPLSEVVEISGEQFYGAGYEDGDRLPPDIAKLQRIGWSPRHDLRATMRDAMEYYLERRPHRVGGTLQPDAAVLGDLGVPAYRPLVA
jgi:UDP-apiose/xylose synthase